MSQKVHILAIGVHPDDVELGCAGTLLKHMALGYKVGIVDLTKGELGTRGSGEIRLKEAEAAAEILGIDQRENLGLRDGFFENNEASQVKLIELIRKYQPEIVLANAVHDRHPDHARAANLVYDACFLSGLPKVETIIDGKSQAAWRPKSLYNYIQFLDLKPDFVVDISNQFEKKMESILAYKSQFHDPNSKEPETFISSPDFLDFIASKFRSFGKHINATYAEGFTANKYLGVENLLELK